MNNETNVYQKHSSICWNAIIAGTIVAVGLLFLFNVLSLGIGLSSLTSTKGGVEILALSAFIWVFIGTYVIFFLSANVTGKLAHVSFCNSCTGSSSCCNENKESHLFCTTHGYGMLYGFMTWSLATLLGLILISNFTGPQKVLVSSIQNQMLTSKFYTNGNFNENVGSSKTQGSASSQPTNSQYSETGSSNNYAFDNQASPNTKVVSNETKKQSHKMGLMDLAFFLLLFSGAVGSICGGYYSSRYHHNSKGVETKSGTY
jgi:hypothetical protein